MGSNGAKEKNPELKRAMSEARGLNDQEDHQKTIDEKIQKSGQQIETDTKQQDSRHAIERELSKKQIQKEHNASKEDNKAAQWFQDLKESLHQHQKLLLGLDAKVEEEIGRYITKNTVNKDGDTARTEGANTRLEENAEDNEMKIKALCESISKPLTDSFKTFLEQFQRSEKAQKEVETSNAKVRELEEQIRQLQKDASKHKSVIKELQQPNRTLTSFWGLYRPKKGHDTIQLFYLHDGNTISDIENELKAMMANKLKNFSFQTCKRSSEIDPNKLVIVLYIVTTRVGADAANAIKDIKNPGNTMLVLIHYKNVHSLTSERSSDVLNDQPFRNLRGILDLAFMADSGFFHCKMNESGIDALCALCRQRPGRDTL